MKNVMLITRRELAAFLKSPMGYIIVAAVLCIDGLLFNAYALGEGKPFDYGDGFALDDLSFHCPAVSQESWLFRVE